MAHQQVNSIVVIDWSMIGDLIMLSPCIKAIHRHHPEARLGILGQPGSIETYKHHPDVGQLIPYERSRGEYDLATFKATVAQLREEKYDLAYIFHNSIGSALMARMAKIPRRVGYRYEMRDLLLTTRLRIPARRQHLMETKADMLRLCGVEVNDLTEEVYIDEAAARKWVSAKLGPNFGRNRPIIAVSIGATKEYKHWSADGLNAFLNRFPVNTADFVFLGAPSERKLYEGVYSYNNTVVDLVGQTTIEELTWVLNQADLFVGPDSGPMHLAIARKTPVVALFGPTDPSRCGPYKYEASVVVRSERICRECDTAFGKNIRQCLHTIDAEETYCAAVGLLAQHCRRWSIENV